MKNDNYWQLISNKKINDKRAMLKYLRNKETYSTQGGREWCCQNSKSIFDFVPCESTAVHPIHYRLQRTTGISPGTLEVCRATLKTQPTWSPVIGWDTISMLTILNWLAAQRSLMCYLPSTISAAVTKLPSALCDLDLWPPDLKLIVSCPCPRTSCVNWHQVVLLSQRGHAMLRVIEYFAKSLKVIWNDTVE